MSFSQVVILQLVILGVVLESDLGRKKIGGFRVLRPVIAAALIVPFFLTEPPASGGDLALQAAGALVGIALGLVSVSPALVAVGIDPDYRGRIARWRHRPGHPAAVSRSGAGYAALWIAVTIARVVFAYTSQHTFPDALGRWLHDNSLSALALTNGLILLAVGMDLFRSVGLFARRSRATRTAAGRGHAQVRAGAA